MIRSSIRVVGRLALATLTTLLVGAVFASQPASAHDRRTIANGQVEAVVGFMVEPALADEPNGVDFRVTNVATKQPVEGLEKTVKVEVIKGATTRTFDLRARFGMPGAYTADLMPTAIGDYTFRFVGEVNGVKIDEKFESGPGRFAAVEPVAKIQFPTITPSNDVLQAQVTAANSAADSARLLGIAGIVVGVIGLAVGGAALMMRSKGDGPAPSAAD